MGKTTKTNTKPKPGKRGANSPTSVRSVKAASHALSAVELRLKGYSFDQIGVLMHMSGEGARQAVVRAIEQTATEMKQGAEYLREIERQRMERMIKAVMPKALLGGLQAIDEARKLSESLRKLLGLDLQGMKITLDGGLDMSVYEYALNKAYGVTPGAGIALEGDTGQEKLDPSALQGDAGSKPE